jgi:hypothetical protein
MKTLLTLVLIALILNSFQSFAQKDTSYWKKTFQTGLNLNQASFSDNWKGGGANSMALGLFFNGKIDYLKSKISFNNDLQLQYGILKNAEQSTRKNIDRIFLDSKLGYKISKSWNLYVSVNYLSQFDLGYTYGKDSLGEETKTVISKFMSPAYLSEAIGLEWKPKPYFWLRMGTGTLRHTFVMDTSIHNADPKNYGVPIGKTVRNEIAFQLIANFDKDIMKNVNLKLRYSAFAGYEDLEAIDNRIDLTLTAKINKYINVNLSAIGLYDQDQDYEFQYSEAIAIGFLYTF